MIKCATCNARCMPPHTQCSRCKPRPSSQTGSRPYNREKAKAARQRRRMALGVPETWEAA